VTEFAFDIPNTGCGLTVALRAKFRKGSGSRCALLCDRAQAILSARPLHGSSVGG